MHMQHMIFPKLKSSVHPSQELTYGPSLTTWQGGTCLGETSSPRSPSPIRLVTNLAADQPEPLKGSLVRSTTFEGWFSKYFSFCRSGGLNWHDAHIGNPSRGPAFVLTEILRAPQDAFVLTKIQLEVQHALPCTGIARSLVVTKTHWEQTKILIAFVQISLSPPKV